VTFRMITSKLMQIIVHNQLTLSGLSLKSLSNVKLNLF